MTPEQIEQLGVSRRAVDSLREAISREFLAILGELDADTHRLFRGVAVNGRPCDVGGLLDLLVQANEDPRRLVPVAAGLGRHHASAGVSRFHYHTAGVALLRALERVLGDKLTPEARATWAEAYALVTAVMERGAHRTGEHRIL